MWNNLNNITFFMKKSLFLLLFSICSIAAFAQTKINPTTLLKAGPANSFLKTDATGIVDWALISTLTPVGQGVTTTTAGLTLTGNTAAALTAMTINIATANTSTTGLLTGADWTTFNAKAPAFTITGSNITYAANVLSVPNLAGDVTGTLAANTVVKLQTVPVSNTAPTTGQVLAYSGTAWTPTTQALNKRLTYVGEVVVATAGATATVAGITATVDTDIYVWRSGVKMLLEVVQRLHLLHRSQLAR
jgi:hypothetical protein